MSNEVEIPVKRGKGRPPKPKEDKTDSQFHLVLLEEEMELIKIAAKLSGSTSAAAFIRAAIRQLAHTHAQTAFEKNIPEGLRPMAEQVDKPKKHFPLLLSAEDRELVEHFTGGSSVFIRTAALAMVFSNPGRNAAFKTAVLALTEKKRKIEAGEAPESSSKPKRKAAARTEGE